MIQHISLGSDCSIAYHLQNKGLRTVSYPFDWILMKRQESIMRFIKNPILNSNNFIIKRQSSNFNIIHEHWDDTNKPIIRVYDKSLKIHFVHDFNDMSNVDNVIQKYVDRIDRFICIMQNKDVRKILYRIGNNEDVSILNDFFIEQNFQNFKIKYKNSKDVIGDDWKRDKFDWDDWFLNDL